MIWGLSLNQKQTILENLRHKISKRLIKASKKLYLYDPIAMENAKQELNKLTNIEFIRMNIQKLKIVTR